MRAYCRIPHQASRLIEPVLFFKYDLIRSLEEVKI